MPNALVVTNQVERRHANLKKIMQQPVYMHAVYTFTVLTKSPVTTTTTMWEWGVVGE